jgi:serine/threonine-protein kinase
MEYKSLGRYQILEEVGRGSMGIVYKGYDPNIERIVALKTISQDPGLDPEEQQELLKRFFQEARTAGRLSHRNIVSIFDTAEEHGIFYIVMEFIEGDTLENQMRSGRKFEVPEVLDIVAQICDGLDYAHRKGVVHRDIKPANIMITADGLVKITDFGVAKVVSSHLTQTGSVLGTPSYMSPEQVGGKKVDHRADLFSVGVVLYELLTGVKPFKGESIHSIMYKIVYDAPVSPLVLNPELPPSCEWVIQKALSKKPEDRFQSAAEMSDALRDLSASSDEHLAQYQETTLIPTIGAEGGGMTSADQPTVLIDMEQVSAEEAAAPAPPRSDSVVISPPSEAPPAPPRGRAWVFGVLVFLVVLAGLVYVGMELLPVAPTQATTGGLSVTTSPPGAHVYVGDREIGVTPIERYKLPPGKHRLRLELDGYRPEEREIEIVAGEVVNFSGLELAPQAQMVSFDVLSEPPGAMVFLRDEVLGQTPLIKAEAEAGTHILRVRHEGYKEWSDAIELKEGEPNVFKIELEKAGARLRVVSDPPGATVYLNQARQGETPWEAEDLADGEYRISLKKWGYETHTQVVRLEPGDDQEISATLRKLPTGSIKVTANPPAKVYLDGSRRGHQTPYTFTGVTVGTHKLTFSHATLGRVTKSVQVQANKVLTVSHTFANMGKLSVNAKPFGDVYVDGKKRGSTPCMLDLPEGTYTIRVVNPNTNAECVQPVQIIANDTKFVRCDLTQ